MSSSSVDHANPYTNQIFQEAVTRNDIAVAKLLLKHGINPRRNERNIHGLTALQQSILDGHARMAVILLEAGADIEAKTSNGWTCLHIASAIGDLDVLTLLISHCAHLVALTKNEELPIDLAATREIKIELAKEMTRIGYSELAQWYMRKLAAREGVFYVWTTDRLLDMACDDHYDSRAGYPYIVRKSEDDNSSSSSSFTRQSAPFFQIQEYDAGTGYWQENMKYLTSSSGYKSEVVYDSRKGEYVTGGMAVVEEASPARQLGDCRTSICEDGEEVYTGSLRRNGSMRNYNSIQRKASKIELHIDYTNSTEDDEDEENEIKEEESETKTPIRKCDSQSTLGSRSSRYDSEDNEFCNCPNCKKMGYAFSPDIRKTGRKFAGNDEMNCVYPATSQYYPATTTSMFPNYYEQAYQDVPRKRKNKLLSGIKSIFNKDGVKVKEQPIVGEEAGILFAKSLRDRNKVKQIKQRNSVHKSNSFTAGGNKSEEYHVFPHDHIVPQCSLDPTPSSFHSSTNTITDPTETTPSKKAVFVVGNDNEELDQSMTDARIDDVMEKITTVNLDSSADEDLIL